PIDKRRAKKANTRLAIARAMTFRQCAEAFIRAKAPEWRNAVHARQWPQSLEAYVYPVFGDLPVDAVDTTLVMQALEPLWASRPETASRVRGRVEAILDSAKVRGLRQGENPAAWRGHLANLLPKKSKVPPVLHHPALPYADIPAFMAE